MSAIPIITKIIHDWYNTRIHLELLENIDNDRLLLIVDIIFSNIFNLEMEPVDAFYLLCASTDPIYIETYFSQKELPAENSVSQIENMITND